MIKLPRSLPLMPGPCLPVTLLTTALVIMASIQSGQAQETEDTFETPDSESKDRSQLRFAGEGGLIYQSESDIEGPGGASVQVNRFDAGVAFQTDLSDRLRWLNTFFLGIDHYDFDGGGFSAGNPWETILNNRYGTQLAYQIDEHWGVRGGGVVMLNRETDADWGKSFSGGGTFGVDYRQSDSLFISVGLGLTTQIEAGVKGVPMVAVKWLPAEQWTVRVGSVPVSGGAAAGAEVAYQLNEHLDLGFGLLYRERRFRLDDSGPAPDGVGDERTVPLRFRVGWTIHPQITLNFIAGVALGGQLELNDQNGNSLRKENYDPAAYLGLRVASRF